MTKVAIIGAGFVGSTAAYVLAMKGLVDEIALVDILAKPARGKALDIQQSLAVFGQATRVRGGDDYALVEKSDVVVITAGVPRTPEQTREETLATNAKIMKAVIAEVKRRAPGAVLLVVSNPLDAMTWLAAKESGFPKRRVIGMAGTLDTARFAAFLAEALDCSPSDIDAVVLGGHGDLMLPLSRLATAKGKRVDTLLSPEELGAIEERTRTGGTEIVDLLGKGSAYFAVGAAIYDVLEALLTRSRRPVPVSAWLEGEYGLDGLFLGVPCRLHHHGVKEVVELPLTREERRALEESGEAVRKLVAKL